MKLVFSKGRTVNKLTFPLKFSFQSPRNADISYQKLNFFHCDDKTEHHDNAI